MTFKKTALTVYGLLGTDWIRLTVARIIETGETVAVRADGSNAILSSLPVTFRTSGDMVAMAATLGHRVNMAAVPSVAFPAHDWKGTYTLDEAAKKFGVSKSIVTALRASYTEGIEVAA